MNTLARDAIAGALVVAVCAVVFGYHSSRLGFYADDAGFLLNIYPGMSIQDLFAGISSYVTGRNLHILWQYFVTIAAGGSSVDNVPAMHFVQVAADATAGLLLFLALRLWGVMRAAAWFTAIAFSLFPNHGETHFWLSSLPMNIISTIFVLILLCLSELILRASAVNDRMSVAWLGLLLAVFFLCAMFTYDQAVPVTMAITTLLSAAIFYQNRKLWMIAVGFWCFSLAVFASLLVWKVRVPAGGPVFSNLTIEHLVANFVQSYHIWMSILPAFTHPLRAANGTESVLTVVISLAVVAIYFLFRRSEIASADHRDSGPTKLTGQYGIWVRSVALIVAGAVFFVLAYLPAYLWYLSPRHTYLPSVGVAIMLAGGFGLAAPSIEKWTPLKLGALVLMGLMLAGFTSQNLIEKEFWISSYEMRRTMYQEVADRYSSSNPTSFLLSGFPSPPEPGSPTLAFLTGENADALSIITKGKIRADKIALHPVPSNDGYFLRTEIGRWGDDALIHISKQHATIVLFEGLQDQHLNVLYDIDRDQFSSDQFYKLSSIEGSGPITAISARKGPAGGYDVDIPAVSIAPNETLTLVGCTLEGSKLSPAPHASKTDPEQFQIPVDVSADRSGKEHSFHLDYTVSLPGIDGFRLYAVNEERLRLVGVAVIK